MEVLFFNSQVKNDIKSLKEPSLTKSVRLMNLLKMFGNKLGMPYSKKIANNLFELRIRGQQEVRIFYCFGKGKAIIVHHFIKKSQKTPRKEVNIALNRISHLP